MFYSVRTYFLALLARRTIVTCLALSLGLASVAEAETSLKVLNRSKYPMIFGMWKNGQNCTDKIALPEKFNLNTHKDQFLTVPTDQKIAAGIAIIEEVDNLPVACDYILSFNLAAGGTYALEFNVHDRRCYGQLFQEVNGQYQLILPGEAGDFVERISILGWDMSDEPGCEE